MVVSRRPGTARRTGVWNTLPAKPKPTTPTLSILCPYHPSSRCAAPRTRPDRLALDGRALRPHTGSSGRENAETSGDLDAGPGSGWSHRRGGEGGVSPRNMLSMRGGSALLPAQAGWPELSSLSLVSRVTYTQQVIPSRRPAIQTTGPQLHGPNRSVGSFPFDARKDWSDSSTISTGRPESAMKADSATAHLRKSARTVATASRRARKC